MRILPCLTALSLVLLAACARPAEPAVQATAAFCRPVIADRDVTGCYVTLTSAQDDRLVRVESPQSREVQIHGMSMDGGVMRMWEMEDGLPLPAGKAVALKPGGDHLMVMGLKAPLRAGDSATLRLTFDKAPPLEVTAVAGPGPDGASGAHTGH